MGKYDRFLKPVEEGRKQCTLCDHKFNKQQDSATNLYIHHFSRKHPSKYAHINGKREESDDVLNQPLVKKMAQATIIESFQNFLPDGVKTEEGHRAITQFLCVTNQCLNMVNCQGFINMIKGVDSAAGSGDRRLRKTREKCHLDPSGSFYLAEKSVNCGFLMVNETNPDECDGIVDNPMVNEETEGFWEEHVENTERHTSKNASSAANKGTNSKKALQGGGDEANPAFN
uniref:Uncharacterized protein n=2 Tax=Caenorhabditis japonica TaxID=281687 RepID=A0A8R1IME1_CAEJA